MVDTRNSNRANLKMPGFRGRAGRLILSGMLAMTMGSAFMVAPSMALAEDGSFTITAKDNDLDKASNKFKVYELFKADITPADNNAAAHIDGVATHIAWANGVDRAAQSAIVSLLKTEGYNEFLEGLGLDKTSDDVTHNPQSAAEFIGQKIAGGEWDAGAATTPSTPAAQSFADKLARLVIAQNIAPGTATANQAFTGEEGYYLFVSDDSTVTNTTEDYEAGSAAIWVPIGGKTTSITEKTSLPTIEKQVKEDSGTAWGKAADGNKDQDLNFKLTTTMPQNIGAFSKYHVKFTDELPATGMSLKGGNTSSVKVKIYANATAAEAGTGAIDVTSQIPTDKLTYSSDQLVIDIADIKTLKVDPSAAEPVNVDITKDSIIVVEYDAHLDGDAAIGNTGNENTAKLTFTKNPVTLQDGDTTDVNTKTYTYQLELAKVDKQTHKSLAGAKFTMQVATGNSDAGSVGKYVQADGSLGAEPYEFTTGADGTFTVQRIDEGTYTLHETAAPTGYALEDADISVVVTSTLNQTTGALTNLAATVSGGEQGKTADSDVVTHLATAADAAYNVGAVDAATGYAGIVTSDDKQLDMPITGEQGYMLLLLAGAGIMTISVAGIYRNRRRRNDAAQL